MLQPIAIAATLGCVFAAMHAWLELPVLALACGVGPRLASAPAGGA